MKSYTELEQSKKLAEILPIESADHFHIIGRLHTDGPKYEIIRSRNEVVETNKYWPCWSLAALLGVLLVMIDYKGSLIRLRIDKGNVGQDDYAIWYDDLDNGLSTNIASESKNFVDACYEMIIKLHELNLL